MGITALVMAGGKATRMNSGTEKPLLVVGSKPMMQHVVDTLRQSKIVDRIVVAVSTSTPETARMAGRLRIEVLETPGEGYISDMKYAIKTLGLHDVLIVSADLPFITSEIVHQAVDRYASQGKPSLAVMTPVDLYRRLGRKPEYVFEVDGENLVPVGVNIIDGTRIDESKLEEAVLVAESEELTLNVNTPRELRAARKHLQKVEDPMHVRNASRTRSPRKVPRTYLIARIAVFSALSVVGSLIHPPSPIQTVAFDSSPGFFVALYFGPLDGALVSGIGHLVTSVINGFPLGVIHFAIALGMMLAGATMGALNRIESSWACIPAVAAGIAVNTGLVVVMVPSLGWGAALTFLPFLLLAAALNGIVAALAYVGVRGRLRA
jgi:adenosylcobinamide-phosphate guanylyltransferase